MLTGYWGDLHFTCWQLCVSCMASFLIGDAVMLMDEKQRLEKNVYLLKVEIRQLMKRRKEQENTDAESGRSEVLSMVSEEHSTKSTKHVEMKRRLDMSCRVNGMKFSDLRETENDGGMYADAEIGPVKYCIAYRLKEKEETFKFDLVEIEFEDPFHSKEMNQCKLHCLRGNNFQLLQKKIVEYSVLFQIREEIVEWLSKEYGPSFSLTKSEDDDEVGYIIGAREEISGLEHFSALWMIEWSPVQLIMINKFCFNIAPLGEENVQIFNELCATHNQKQSYLQALWKQLFDSVQEGAERRRVGHSSSSS